MGADPICTLALPISLLSLYFLFSVAFSYEGFGEVSASRNFRNDCEAQADGEVGPDGRKNGQGDLSRKRSAAKGGCGDILVTGGPQDSGELFGGHGLQGAAWGAMGILE